jgi:phage repressor protein C with HTH and peptisase S24 domain
MDRAALEKLIYDRNFDLQSASKAIGRNPAFLHQHIRYHRPKHLSENDRELLADLLGIEPDALRTERRITTKRKTQKLSNDNQLLTRSGNDGRRGRVQPFLIDEVEVRAAAGGGFVPDDDGTNKHVVIAEWSMPEPFIEARTTAKSIKIIRAYGDSMEPTIQPGDPIMVDIEDRVPSPPGIFVIWDGIGLVVKRVEHIPNSDPPTLRLKSDNKEYSTYERPLADVQIQGRMLGKWRWT